MSLTHPGLLSFVTSEQKAVLTVAEEKQTQTVAKTPQVEAFDSAASEEEKSFLLSSKLAEANLNSSGLTWKAHHRLQPGVDIKSRANSTSGSSSALSLLARLNSLLSRKNSLLWLQKFPVPLRREVGGKPLN
jgi:hypothetical protein